MKTNAVVFLGDHFLWSVFRASLGNFGINPSHLQKYACSYTNDQRYLIWEESSCTM